MSRAYIAGFGTTGLLVAAAFFLLAVASTLVAFHGWPEQDLPDPIRSYTVDEPSGDSQAGAAGRAAPAGGATPAADAGRARADARRAAGASDDRNAPGAARAGGGSAPRSEPAPVRRVPSSGRGEVGEAPARGVQPVEAEAPGQSRLKRDPAAGGLQRLGRSLGDTTKRVTDGLGGLLSPLSPQLAGAVQGTGDVLAQRLRALGAPRSSR